MNLQSLLNPVTFQRIKDLPGIPISTANDIWLYSGDNEPDARLAEGGILEKQLSLLELVDVKCLDPDTCSRRPEASTKIEKDHLIASVKSDFTTRRIKLVDLCKVAGLSHVGDGTLQGALVLGGLHAYHEEFKPILGLEHKLNCLVRIISLLLLLHWPKRPQGLFGYTCSVLFPDTNNPFPSISNRVKVLFTAHTVGKQKFSIFTQQALG